MEAEAQTQGFRKGVYFEVPDGWVDSLGPYGDDPHPTGVFLMLREGGGNRPLIYLQEVPADVIRPPHDGPADAIVVDGVEHEGLQRAGDRGDTYYWDLELEDRVLRLEFQDVLDGYMDDMVAVVESIRFMSPEEAAELIGEP